MDVRTTRSAIIVKRNNHIRPISPSGFVMLHRAKYIAELGRIPPIVPQLGQLSSLRGKVLLAATGRARTPWQLFQPRPTVLQYARPSCDEQSPRPAARAQIVPRVGSMSCPPQVL